MCAPGGDEREESVRRFRVMLLRRAYPLADHLPPRAVLNLRRVDVDPQGRYVMLTLHTGTQLLDTGDRITVRGEADDVAVEELVSCCERRGWARVEVHGWTSHSALRPAGNCCGAASRWWTAR